MEPFAFSEETRNKPTEFENSENFNSMEINKNGAQLIFTSHDLLTTNNDIFRRDEIWFVAKGKEQNSK